MLQKQPVAVNFAMGLDLKTDPFQVRVGNFLQLVNSVFTTSNRLSKRNGFKNLTSLPDANQTTLTTLNDNLIATGSNLYAYSEDTNQWLNQGIVQPIQLNTLALTRVSTSQTSSDSALAPNGLLCLAYMDSGGQSYYQISDPVTGQQIVSRQLLPGTATAPRVFLLGNYFIVMFLNTVAGAPHIQYIAIPTINPTSPRVVATFAANPDSTSVGWDGIVTNNTLYVAYGTNSAEIQIGFLTSSLAVALPGTSIILSASSVVLSLSADTVARRVFITWFDGTSVWSAGYDFSLNSIMFVTPVTTGVTVAEITSISSNNVQTIFYQAENSYGYDAAIRTDYIVTTTVTAIPTGTGPGTVGPLTILLRSVGLASKPFVSDTGLIYVLVVYGDTHLTPASDDSNQPTYFLVDINSNIYMKLAYSNGGGYEQSQVLPSVSLSDDTFYVTYLVTDFLATVNKGTNLPDGSQVNAIYTQTGINLAKFQVNVNSQFSVEIAKTLNLTGGLMWEYDGVKPVENNFNVWPENVEVTTATSGGFLADQTYFYVFTYEWTNNAGNLERSAPSIPVSIVTTGGGTSTNTIHVPTLRLTAKQPFNFPPSSNNVTNPVRIVGYRWSTAQQVYYQFTSLTSPTLNDPTIDYVTFTDTQADIDILGNVILYTTGGVIEDIGAPPSIAIALFDNRVWLVDAEDQNLLWYSKQVIENVPVEMSDLLTLYVAPTTSAQGSTGTVSAIYPMDDKLIVFKKDAAYYINGTGPDNTGANNQYSQPIFITSSVGCTNPNSIVLIPSGLMFQSDKGIWLLGRDLSTNYIGAPVESFNSQTVLSATAVPGTTQVRFILDTGTTLMYDYYFQQWGTHTNVLAISATLYQGLHTYMNSLGQIFQETPGLYTDGTTPVLMNFTTSWINIAGLQGFERFYFAFLLGTYFSPFKLNVSLAYNYNPSPSQNILMSPSNYVPNWGDEAVWGSGGPWGGPEAGTSDNNQAGVFAERFFPEMQKCSSFQVSIQELYDPSLGQSAGEGLTLSGLNLIVGIKRGFRTQSAGKSFG